MTPADSVVFFYELCILKILFRIPAIMRGGFITTTFNCGSPPSAFQQKYTDNKQNACEYQHQENIRNEYLHYRAERKAGERQPENL